MKAQVFYTGSTFNYLRAMLVSLLLSATLAVAEPQPLAPPDTSSPRATLKSYQDIMSEYGRLMRTDLHTKKQASELDDQRLEDKA